MFQSEAPCTSFSSFLFQTRCNCILLTQFQRAFYFSGRPQNCEKRLLASSCLFVRMKHLGPHCTDFRQIWDFSFFFKNLSRDLKFHYNSTRITGTLHDDVFTFMTISCWILLIIRNILDKIVENQNIFCVQCRFFHKLCRLSDNVEKYSGIRRATNCVTVRRIRVACYMSKATCTHANAHTHTYISIIYCFSTATMIRECTSMLRYASLVKSVFIPHK